MAKVLLIKESDFVKFTNASALLDTDKYKQYIGIAQDIYLENYLGQKLLEKLQLFVENNNIVEPYTTLLNKYVSPMCIHWGMYEYMNFAPFQMSNKGVFKHTSESAETATDIDMKRMIAKQKDIAELYTKRFQDYIRNKNTQFPEYYEYTEGETNSQKDIDFYGWVL